MPKRYSLIRSNTYRCALCSTMQMLVSLTDTSNPPKWNRGAALLLLMLEAVTTDLVFTISLKRSTQNLQLSTSWAGRLPHLGPRRADIVRSSAACPKRAISEIADASRSEKICSSSNCGLDFA